MTTIDCKRVQLIQSYQDTVQSRVCLFNENDQIIAEMDLAALRKDKAQFYQLSPHLISELSYLSGWTDQRNCEQQIREELAALRRKHEKRRNLLMKQRKARQAAKAAKLAEAIV